MFGGLFLEDMYKYSITQKKTDCFGCRACEQICYLGAITMQPDEEGFFYPVIDNTKCISCGKCAQVCPIVHDFKEDGFDQEVYAAYARDNSIRQSSSSGGLFSIIAKETLAQNGVVFGAAFNENMYLQHIGIDKESDLPKLKGSKYVQSDTAFTFIQVKKHLTTGRKVYYAGTPCQIAGLKKYLGKDYENLLTSDLVCHGVPSPLLFQEHLIYLEKKKKGKVADYSFRNCQRWGVAETVVVSTGSKIRKSFLPSYLLSPYLNAFIKGLVYRPVCYECPYASAKRLGDITLADFWGVKKFLHEIDSSKGVSLVLINNSKGKLTWNKISSSIISYSSNIEDALMENPSLRYATPKSFIRDSIYQKLATQSYDELAENEFRIKNWHFVRYKLMLLNFLFSLGLEPLLIRLNDLKNKRTYK